MVTAQAKSPDLSEIGLRASFFWTFTGTVVYAACNWGLLATLAKLGGTDTLGKYAFGVAVATPIFLLTSMSLRSVLATDAAYRHSFTEYLALRIFSSIVALLIVAAVLLMQHLSLSLAAIVMTVALIQAIESVSDIYWGRMQRLESMRPVSVSMIARGGLSLILLGITFLCSKNLALSLAGVIAARTLVLFAYDVPGSRRVEIVNGDSTSLNKCHQVSWRNLRTLAWTASPLGVTLMLASLAQTTPLYFVKHYRTLSDVGLYAAMLSLLSIGTTVINALGQAALPRLARYYASGELSRFRKVVMEMVCAGFLTGASGIFVASIGGSQVLRIMYRPEFAQRSEILIAIFVSGSLLYIGMLLGYASTAARAFRPQVPLFALIAIVSCVASYYLVRSHGLMGAALAVGAAGSAHLGGEAIICWTAIRKREHELLS